MHGPLEKYALGTWVHVGGQLRNNFFDFVQSEASDSLCSTNSRTGYKYHSIYHSLLTLASRGQADYTIIIL